MVRIWETGKAHQRINENKTPLPLSEDVVSLSVNCEAHWICGTERDRYLPENGEKREYDGKGFDKKIKTLCPSKYHNPKQFHVSTNMCPICLSLFEFS